MTDVNGIVDLKIKTPFKFTYPQFFIVFLLLSFLWVWGFSTYDWKVPQKKMPSKTPLKRFSFVKKICLVKNNKLRLMLPEVDTVLAETVFAEIVIVLLSFWSPNPGRFFETICASNGIPSYNVGNEELNG